MGCAFEGVVNHMSVLHNVAHFVRWRVIALRYAGKLRGLPAGRAFGGAAPRTAAAQRIAREGHAAAPALGVQELADMVRIYRPRIDGVVRRDVGHPFVNLFSPEDIDAANPVVRRAFSPEILDVAADYFGGRLVLDSIQVLYSWPTAGALRESQLWHKDYGDWKSFHWIAYLNDVNGPDDGPFSFIDKRDARRIAPSPFIRRIADDDFSRELKGGQVRVFAGRAGDSIFVDPAACYHCGSRCRNPRLAVFVTFNTSNPFVAPTAPIRENRQRIFEAARSLRPDLSDGYLRRLLQIQ